MIPEISFVIPCYNEAGNVMRISDEITRVFGERGISVECVFVNDGSKDATDRELKTLFEEHPERSMTIVRFSRNFGKEAAILAGLKRAKGSLLCFIDADLQQRPEVALQMYEILSNDPDTDCVAAYVKDRKEGGFMNFCKRSFYSLINSMCIIEFKNGASDFRMMRRSMADAVLSMTEYQRFSKGLFSFVGFNTFYLDYIPEKRTEGVSKWNFIKLVRYAMEGIVGYTTRPLEFPLITGGVLTVLSVIYLIVMLILTIAGVLSVPELFTIGAVLLVGGLILLSIGITAMYLGRTYMQVKNRPVFIEKEVLERNTDGFTEER